MSEQHSRSWFGRFNEKTGPPSPEAPEATNITAALTVLAGWIGTMIGPAAVWQMPHILNDGPATDAADRAGRTDAASPFDEWSHDPRLPHENTVPSVVTQLLHLIGLRAYAILAAYETGTLSQSAGAFTIRKTWQRLSWMTWGLIVLAGILEMWLGATLWERLIGAGDAWSWLVGLVWALIVTIGTVAAAIWISDHRPGLLEDHGLWVFAFVALVFASLLTAYAYALSGGATAEPSTGGASGGGAAGTSTALATEDGANWILMVVYLGAMAFIALVVLFSHVHDLADEKREMNAVHLAALDAQLDTRGQLLLCIQLLEACVVLAYQAKKVIQALIRAYVGGARSVLTPALSSLWDTYDLEHGEVEDPEWLDAIRGEIKRLKHERDAASGHDEDPPPLSLIRAS